MMAANKKTSEITVEQTNYNYQLDVAHRLPASKLCVHLLQQNTSKLVLSAREIPKMTQTLGSNEQMISEASPFFCLLVNNKIERLIISIINSFPMKL